MGRSVAPLTTPATASNPEGSPAECGDSEGGQVSVAGKPILRLSTIALLGTMMKTLPVVSLLFLLCLCSSNRVRAVEWDSCDRRSKLVMDAALADPAKLTGGSPMHFWVAQRLFETGGKERALGIVRAGMKRARAFIEKRESMHHENIGYNGFIYWAALNCYVHWHQDFDAELLEDYRYVFTHARNYKGTTSNLSMIHTLALLLADNIWGADSLPKDGKFGPRGDKAIKWLTERVERIAKRGSGEFASRPYMIFNVGTLLTLDNDFVPAELRKKAAMAYEMSIAHGAATWLRGHWAVPSGRSYPDQLTQQPTGSAALLWTYFGGVTPRLDAGTAAIFSAGEKFRPHPLVVKAATDRSQPYVCRSRFDGDRQFQTTFMNKTYAVFSTAVLPGSNVWGQTYPYGVMWDEPDVERGSHLWLTVPAEDEKKLGFHTHGINGRAVQFAQRRGSFVMVAPHLDDPKNKYPYVLGYIPGGWRAMTNDSAASGHIFLHYGSVMIAISASQKFEWHPQSGVLCGSPRRADSEFRVRASTIAMGLETALPSDFPGDAPDDQLAAFRAAVLKHSRLEVAEKTDGGEAAATFTDHGGNTIERTFDGDTRINGEREKYETWSLLENPWMHQEWDGNLTISDGSIKRVYNVSDWTITETPCR